MDQPNAGHRASGNGNSSRPQGRTANTANTAGIEPREEPPNGWTHDDVQDRRAILDYLRKFEAQINAWKQGKEPLPEFPGKQRNEYLRVVYSDIALIWEDLVEDWRVATMQSAASEWLRFHLTSTATSPPPDSGGVSLPPASVPAQLPTSNNAPAKQA
ncbi:hypothetical protein OPT61_g8527 [Boeremia exigua]|uniref:Uncharacterized protein n=1 Tax=Boeremia exigua TaxID=749465 RepID=A0ACC2HXW8_9PLEO|nr:hypothetical protein OPT61_g8527 [Boeremia exigua]